MPVGTVGGIEDSKRLAEYVLQLEASDDEFAGFDIVTINVYNDGLQADLGTETSLTAP